MTASDRPPRYVLGVNTGPHDGSAAVLRDGRLIAMLEQERISRNRYAQGESPAAAIAACMQYAGIGLADLRTIAVGWDVPRLCTVEGVRYDRTEFLRWMLGSLWDGRERVTLRYVDHHMAHAASAFYTSGFQRAAILIADGRGETVATSLAVGGPAGIEVIKAWGVEASLGHIYGWVADWIGLSHWGAGKLMGLAAYGRAEQPVPLVATADGYLVVGGPSSDTPTRQQFMLSRSRTRAYLRTAAAPFEPGSADDVMAYADLAASMQRALEDSILSLARLARRLTNADQLVMAGGVALNCSANGRLQRSGLFDEVWVPPFPNDAGVSIGAALVADHEISTVPPNPSLAHAFWAPNLPTFDASSLESLNAFDIEQHDDRSLPEVVAEYLADGLVVGWCQGRAEVGQRALGARSILCDPRSRHAVARVNHLKGRESWRPLAPALLSADFRHFFDGDPGRLSDFMLAAWPVRPAARTRIPAAVHVDGSARPQRVHPEHSRFCRLLEAFRERSGVPVLINTSFNVAGEPMVLTAQDALNTLLRSDLDALVLEDLVIRRPQNRSVSQIQSKGYRPLSFTPWITHPEQLSGGPSDKRRSTERPGKGA